MARFVRPPRYGDICDEDKRGAKGRSVMPVHGAILLGEVARHPATIHIACNLCPRQGKASIIRLMHEHGPDMPIPARRLAARIAEPCGVHLLEWADMFVKKPAG
jgi:hypothetical protein